MSQLKYNAPQSHWTVYFIYLFNSSLWAPQKLNLNSRVMNSWLYVTVLMSGSCKKQIIKSTFIQSMIKDVWGTKTVFALVLSVLLCELQEKKENKQCAFKYVLILNIKWKCICGKGKKLSRIIMQAIKNTHQSYRASNVVPQCSKGKDTHQRDTILSVQSKEQHRLFS